MTLTANSIFKNTFIWLGFMSTLIMNAQEIELLIKNGHVVDAKNNIDTIMDISIADGKIMEVAPDISDKHAGKVIDATDLYVVPGLIDPHTHVFVGPESDRFANGNNSLSPDDFSFKSGVTTVIDAGTSGWRNFPLFKSQVIEQSKTRILSFLNISAYGMSGDDMQNDLAEMDIDSTTAMIKKYPEFIVGVKIGHYSGTDWQPFERTLKVGQLTKRPIFVECHMPGYSLEAQLALMRPGDIITHSFEHIEERAPVVDTEGKVLPYVMAAKKKGVLFDVGHGGAGFWFDQGIPAVDQGLWPDSFGTDLHRFSMNAGMKDMLNVMSKFLNMGMPLKEVLTRGSWAPAKAIKREDLGNLSVGAIADIALLRLRKGEFGFIDARNNVKKGDQKLEAELTVKDGKVVWDLNGLAANPIDEGK